jgi:hypothetical protein
MSPRDRGMQAIDAVLSELDAAYAAIALVPNQVIVDRDPHVGLRYFCNACKYWWHADPAQAPAHAPRCWWEAIEDVQKGLAGA